MTAVTSTSTTTVIRMTARGRRALALLVAMPVLAVVGIGAAQAATAIAGEQASSASFEHITVQAGQSLWQIAQSLAPESDPRDVIAEIEMLNGIGGAIQPGQQLAIPTQYTD